MGHDDRERKFEQALARHLRAAVGAQNDADAKSPDAETQAEAACPDAAALAAFHERMLSSEEMNAAKAHVAACSRCQEILAQLEATDEVVAGSDRENVLEMREPVLAGGGRYQAEEDGQPRGTIAAQPSRVLNAPKDISRARTWRWVASGGAIAAGLLVWVVAHENRLQTLRQQENMQVAQKQTANNRLADDRLIPATPAPEPTPSARVGRLDNTLKNQSGTKRPTEELGERDAAKGRSSGALGGIVAGAMSDKNAQAQRREGRNAVSGAAGAAAPPKPARESKDEKNLNAPVIASDAAAAPDQSMKETGQNTLREGEFRAGAGAPMAASAKPATPSSEAAKSAAKQNGDAAAQKKSENAPVVTTSQAELTANYERASSLENINAENAKTILAPGGTVLWRLRPAGKIERSADSGITWSQQNSGTMLELLTGSAPSDEVCWIVGRRGTILRTTDGGAHWRKVVSPVAGDVGGIQATDAMHAAIFDLDDRGRFATNDGGATWFLTTK